jgi:hypothetical protein
VLLRWQAPQPFPAHRATWRTWLVVAGDPYVNGYVNPYVIPYAQGVAYPWLRWPRVSVQLSAPSGERSASRD